MGAFLAFLMDFFASFLARIFSVEVAKFLAYKVLLSFLLFTGLVIVYQMILAMTLDWLSQLLQQYASSQNVVLQVAGLGGWMLSQLRMQDCISILTSAMTVRLLLRLVPLSPTR